MLIDENIHAYWKLKYDQINEIKRFGTEAEDGDVNVEIYLK